MQYETTGIPKWQLYERLIARLISNEAQTDLCVTPNASILGRSGIRRQIDVLIECRHDTDNSTRVIVDAKKRSRKINITDVEAFRGLMEDVSATHGYLVSPAGFTKAAEKRAQTAVSIRIVPLDRLADFDPSSWPQCINQGCTRGHVFWNGYPEISAWLLPQGAKDRKEAKAVKFVHYVGKCDRCRGFHVKCLTCGDLLAPTKRNDDVGHQCSCKMPWFWLASIEVDNEGRKSAELHFCSATGVETVDRCSI